MSLLSERARGRWPAILPQLGIPPRFLNGKHQPCLLCGGKDRARFDDKNGLGSYFCNQCGPGSGIDLLMRVHGWDFRETARRVEALIGGVAATAPRPERSDDDMRAALNRLWCSSNPVQPGDAVSRWLSSRVGLVRVPSCLRCHPRARYRSNVEGEMDGAFPAMVAMVTGPDGRPGALHRTYLTADGRKAPVAAPRKLLGRFPKGGAIRLMPHQGMLGIAEGIETAFAAASLFAVPCWAAVHTEGLKSWVVPDDVRDVIVFADHDRKYAGQAAAFALAHRIAVRGLAVRVELPPSPGLDWGDILNEQSRTLAAAQ